MFMVKNDGLRTVRQKFDNDTSLAPTEKDQALRSLADKVTYLAGYGDPDTLVVLFPDSGKDFSVGWYHIDEAGELLPDVCALPEVRLRRYMNGGLIFHRHSLSYGVHT